jgi:hypothetical protein
MTLEVWCSQDALPTSSSGTTDLAHGSVTTVPVAALHVSTTGVTNGTTQDVARMFLGMSDGTDERFSTITMQTGVTPSDCNHLNGTDGCMAQTFAASAGVDGKVSHNSFIAGGQRVNNDNGFAAARLCNSMFFKCEFAKVLTATLSATVDTAVNVDPGFNADCLITFAAPRAATSANTEAEIHIGFHDGTNQGGILFNSDHGDAAADPSSQISTTYVGGELALGTGALDYGVLAAPASGTSWDLTPKNAGGDSDVVFCLFLGWTSAESVSVFSWTSPTSTGADAQTGLGFQPQALLNLFSFAAAYDTAEQGADAGAWGVGMETADDQFCAALADEFNVNPTDTQSVTNNQSIDVDIHTGAAGDAATLTSLDADGFTHNYSAVEGTANRMLTLAFEVAASNTATPHLRERLYI